jgi:hypothetical protein
MRNVLNDPWVFGFLLAIGLAVILEIGFRVGLFCHVLQHPDRKEQMGAMRDGLFVLLSLLLGFTLTLAATRFVERRSVLVDEAISIGTTYLRAGTLPSPYAEHSRNLVREYVDARLDLENAGTNAARIAEPLSRAKRIHEELWSDAIAVAAVDRTAITAAYINSLNETIDLYEKRLATFENRVPTTIWVLIVAVSLIAVFTRGLSLSSRFWLNLVLAPVTIAIVVALIADLDSPSRGLLRIDKRAMERLKADIASPSH